MSKIIDRSFQSLAKAWDHVTKIAFKSLSLETNPQFIQIVPQGETVIVVSLQVKMQTSSGTLRICYPYLALEPILEKLSAENRPNGSRGETDKNLTSRNTQQIMPVATDIVAILGGTTVTIKDLIDIKLGDVIRLDDKQNDDISLLVGGLNKFVGRPGRIGNHIAVKITKVTA